MSDPAPMHFTRLRRQGCMPNVPNEPYVAMLGHLGACTGGARTTFDDHAGGPRMRVAIATVGADWV